jgi:hypothetical protein
LSIFIYTDTFEVRSMQESPRRRFNIGDAMVLIAAFTPGLILIRIGMNLGLFELGSLTEPGGKRSPMARQLIEFLNVGGGCILAGLVPAVLILGLYRAYPSRRDAVQGPGLIACIVALAASILPIAWFIGRLLNEFRLLYPIYSVPFNNLFGRWMIAAGPMVLGAWITLALLGRWRPRPTWTDRAGCVLGACFVLIYLYEETYFAIFRPLSQWWNG